MKKQALTPMRLVAGLLCYALALIGTVFGQADEQFSETGQEAPRLQPHEFFEPDTLLKWYEAALDDLFHSDEDIQSIAVDSLQQLVAPIAYPYDFVVDVNESAQESDPWAAQLGEAGRGKKQELLANVLDERAKTSVAEAAFILGVLSATGVSPVVDQNDGHASRMYALAAHHGSVSGHLAMAHRYQQGFTVPKSCTIAYDHLKVAAFTFAQQADEDQSYQQKPRQVVLRERSRTAAYTSDAEHLFSSEALSLDQNLAETGDLEAIQRLAYRQLLGVGVEPNVNEAIRAFEGAAQLGDPNAMLNLGLLHTQGINGVANHTRARELFLEASKADLPAAWNGLGHLYLNGLGVEPNTTLAMHYFAKGATLGDADALYNLALIHMYGLGDIPVNSTKALLLLKDAHNLHQIKAPLLLAELHAEFDDVPGGIDFPLAMQYLWVFVDERSDWSEASFDALEMATGIRQDGGSSDMAGSGHGAHDKSLEALPHDPRRAVLLYTVLAEQGSLAACINAAWLLERMDEEDYAGRRDALIRYMYTRAALSDSSPAQIDYANWLLKTALGEKQEMSTSVEKPPHSGSLSQLDDTDAGQASRRRQNYTVLQPDVVLGGSDGRWAEVLRMGLSGGQARQEEDAIEQALLLYTRARMLEDPEGATSLAWMHAAGIGVPKNVTAAIEECRTAIKIASTEAERLAPRVALIGLNVWACLQEWLPSEIEEVLQHAVASLVKALSATMDQIDSVTAPLGTVWNQWMGQW